MTLTDRFWPIPAPSKDGILVHQISDPHAGYRNWSLDELDHMADDIVSGLIPPVDLVALTGDLVDGTYNSSTVSLATQDSYMMAWMPKVAKGVPYLPCIGNHDLRDRTPGYSRTQWESTYGKLGNTYVDVKGWRFITFSVDVHQGLGASWVVPDATWDWIASVCASAPGPIVLAEHYPPWELTSSPANFLEPSSKLDALIAAYPSIVGMLCGHMHFNLNDAQMVQMLSIGGRTIPVVCDISSMLSLNDLTRDQSAQLPAISSYVNMTEAKWEVRYRGHGPHNWIGPSGNRLTTMDIVNGTITHSMG